VICSGYWIDSLSNTSSPLYVYDPIIVTNDEIIYLSRRYRFPCIATNKNMTYLTGYTPPRMIYSEPDDILLSADYFAVRGFDTQTWTQRLWYQYIPSSIYSNDWLVLGNNCTSYIINTDYANTRSFTVYALRELPLQSIIPIVECVKYKGNNLYTVHFGYNNQQSTINNQQQFEFQSVQQNEMNLSIKEFCLNC
jgi:hypothetical protein